MLTRLLAKITGADKGDKYPDQQAQAMGRLGDFTIIFPYGLYCDLPDGALIKELENGKAVPVTVDRPADAARGEPVIFNPTSGAHAILRNNGDIDLIPGAGGVINLGEGGEPIARLGDSVQVNVTYGSSAGTHNGTITSGGGNTST